MIVMFCDESCSNERSWFSAGSLGGGRRGRGRKGGRREGGGEEGGKREEEREEVGKLGKKEASEGWREDK